MTQICQDLMDFIKYNICSDPLLSVIGFIILIAGIGAIIAGIIWLLSQYLLMWLAPLGQTSPLAIVILGFIKQFNWNVFLSFSAMIISYLILAVVIHVQLSESENDCNRSKIAIQVFGILGFIIWFYVFYDIIQIIQLEPPITYPDRG